MNVSYSSAFAIRGKSWPASKPLGSIFMYGVYKSRKIAGLTHRANALIAMSSLTGLVSSCAIPAFAVEVSDSTSNQAAIFSTYEDITESGLPERVLKKVIARGGKSKNYTDLLKLDGGTAGIAHFAVGGLAPLYRHMDTVKYFGRSPQEMIKSYSNACRPTGREGNDTGWGCYSRKWWRDGMSSFLKSPESESIQNAAWSELMCPVVDAALAHGWSSERQIAIALSIANSVGARGFSTLAAKSKWSAEVTLAAYVGTNEHRRRRRDAIDLNFPPSN